MPSRARVVAAYLDGRRIKGFIQDFMPDRGYFFLVPEGVQLGPEGRGLPINFAELKAVFFVKHFDGDPTHIIAVNSQKPGKKLEVTFPDGEKIVGFTLAQNQKGIGFYLQPADSAANNERIFIVNRNVKQILAL